MADSWQHYIYILSLLISWGGLLYLDSRRKLAFFWNARKTAVWILLGVGFFLLWDITGILLDVFWTNQQWVSGLYVVTPDLPIEEFIFLAFLNYITIIFWRFGVCPHRRIF